MTAVTRYPQIPKIRRRLRLDVKPMINRITLYPLSFRSILARTIDLLTGASTWALGSQECSPYTGNLAINASRTPNKIHSPETWYPEGSNRVKEEYSRHLSLYISQTIRNSGTEVTTENKIK